MEFTMLDSLFSSPKKASASSAPRSNGIAKAVGKVATRLKKVEDALSRPEPLLTGTVTPASESPTVPVPAPAPAPVAPVIVPVVAPEKPTEAKDGPTT
jgi:hypothetical protein